MHSNDSDTKWPIYEVPCEFPGFRHVGQVRSESLPGQKVIRVPRGLQGELRASFRCVERVVRGPEIQGLAQEVVEKCRKYIPPSKAGLV